MNAEAAIGLLRGELLKWVDVVAVIVSVSGLMYSLWSLKKDLTTEAHHQAASIISLIEVQ